MDQDKIRGWYLGRHMDHLTDSIAKLSQCRKNWYIAREGVQVDDSPWEKCELVIVIEFMDLSIGQRVNVEVSTCYSLSAIHGLDGIFFCVRWLFCTSLSLVYLC